MLFSYAVIIPMANEENDFESFVSILKDELDRIGSGSVYFIINKVLFYYFFKLRQEMKQTIMMKSPIILQI